MGDSYDNALAETLKGLYKSEVINHQGPWKGVKSVEPPMVWVHWFNTKRIYGGYVSPQKYEEQFYRSCHDGDRGMIFTNQSPGRLKVPQLLRRLE